MNIYEPVNINDVFVSDDLDTIVNALNLLIANTEFQYSKIEEITSLLGTPLDNLNTQNTDTIIDAINSIIEFNAANPEIAIGDLTLLDTDANSNLVEAINEVRLLATIRDEQAQGEGSGLDSDLLDGQHGVYYTDIPARLGYVPINKAGDNFTGNVTILNNEVWHAGNDGAASGLDADLLDGQHGSFYTDINARLGYTAADVAGQAFTGDIIVNHNNAFTTMSSKFLKIGQGLVGGDALVEFHAASSTNTPNADITRGSGVSGRLEFNQYGLGDILFNSEGGDFLFNDNIELNRSGNSKIEINTTSVSGSFSELRMTGARTSLNGIIGQINFNNNGSGVEGLAARIDVTGEGDINVSTGQLKVGGELVLTDPTYFEDLIDDKLDRFGNNNLSLGSNDFAVLQSGAGGASNIFWWETANTRLSLGSRGSSGNGTVRVRADLYEDTYRVLNENTGVPTTAETDLDNITHNKPFSFSTNSITSGNTGELANPNIDGVGFTLYSAGQRTQFASLANNRELYIRIADSTNSNSYTTWKKVSTETDLTEKADLTGATFTGNVRVSEAGSGRVGLIKGSTVNGGYVFIEGPNGENQGYIGNASNRVRLHSYSGYYFDFTGTTDDATPRINGVKMPITRIYDTGEVSWTASGVNTFAHGLGEMPKIIDARLKMTQSVRGFGNNDEVQIATDRSGAVVWADETNIYVRSHSANGIYSTRGSGSANYITTAQANMIIRAFV